MGKLASAPYTDGYGKATQLQFGGLHHRKACADGEIYDMKNMSADDYPLLRPRKRRTLQTVNTNLHAIFGYEKLVSVQGTGLYYGGVLRGNVTAGEKRITAMGARIVIWPDKVILNAKYERLGVFATLDALKAGVSGQKENDAYGVGSGVPYEIYVWNGSEWVSNGKEVQEIEVSVGVSSLQFQNGTYEGVEAECNTLYRAGMNWADYFKVGDAVTISGCTKHTENNKTPIIREIDGGYLRFYENTFVLDGTEGKTDYTETGITLARTAPDLDYICAVDNRVWGCRGDTIYASKLGDPANWNCFEGISTDSYFVDAGTPGDFTACVGYLGYPTFFKEDNLYKMYGSKPTNYQLQASATLGVARGLHKTLAVAGERLFYVSRAGVVSYSGGVPEVISQKLGDEVFTEGAAGSDGRKYYASLYGKDGWNVYVYDTDSGLWMKEDELAAEGFAWADRTLYCLAAGGALWKMNQEPESGQEQAVTSFAEFGDFTEGSLDRKKYIKMKIRLEVETGEAMVSVQYDGEEQWHVLKVFEAVQEKTSVLLSFRPRRCDRFRIRIDGTGAYTVYGITRKVYGGSEI